MSIGKPLLNYHCYIMDEHMNLLPPGAVGELVIGGVSVSRRYVHRICSGGDGEGRDVLVC